MKRLTLLVFSALSALVGSTVQAEAQGLLQTIITPEKAVSVVNESLEGTWLSEVRPAGLPATAPPILNLVTFHPNGTMMASSSDGTQGTVHGVWVRVGGERKFLLSLFFFNYDANRALTTIFKVRVNLQLSADGQTNRSTNEVVVMDRTGKIMATVAGGTATSVRLSPEVPADFADFQKLP